MEPKKVGALLDLAERVLNDSTQLFDDHDHRREAEECADSFWLHDGASYGCV